MTDTYTFHVLKNGGVTYEMEVEAEILTSVKISSVGKPAYTQNRPGRPVQLDDLEINIGCSLRGKGTNNAELANIIRKACRIAA